MECLRCCSSSLGLRISPLARKYVPPRQSLLIPRTVGEPLSVENGPEHVSDSPPEVERPTKAPHDGKPLSFHASSFKSQRLLGTRCFVHSDNRGRPLSAWDARGLCRPQLNVTSTRRSFPRKESRGYVDSVNPPSGDPGGYHKAAAPDPLLRIQLRAF